MPRTGLAICGLILLVGGLACGLFAQWGATDFAGWDTLRARSLDWVPPRLPMLAVVGIMVARPLAPRPALARLLMVLGSLLGPLLIAPWWRARWRGWASRRERGAPPARPPLEPQPPVMLRGRWLLLARAVWLLVAILVLTVFVVNIVLLFVDLRRPPPEYPSVGTVYPYPLRPGDVRALEARGLSLDFYAAYRVADAGVSFAVFFAVGGLIFWRKSAEWIGLVVGLFLVSLASTTAPQGLLGQPGAWEVLDWFLPPHFVWEKLDRFLELLSVVCMILAFYLFPDGRFAPRWMLPLAAGTIALMGSAILLPHSPYDFATYVDGSRLLEGLFGVGWGGSLCFAQIYRYRHVSGPVQRQQTKWAVFGLTTALGGSCSAVYIIDDLFPQRSPLLNAFIVPPVLHAFMLLIPLSLLLAILRYRLWDIDVLINRTLLYGLLTASIVGLYLLAVNAFGALLQAHGSLPVSLLATGVVAALFQPLRDRLQRGVNRLLYGERDEPHAVLARLGSHLEATPAPEAVLQTIVETLAGALKLPHVALALAQESAFTVVATHGLPRQDLHIVPLVYQGAAVGELRLAPRAPGEGFGPADQRFLATFARQAGVAAHAVRLATALQRSRERLVTAREEERRRLRRDLHDGLGPVLSAQILKAGLARVLAPGDPAAVVPLLAELEAALETALVDLRRLIYDLRPPALDDLGLVGALQQAAAQYHPPPGPAATTGPGAPCITVEAPERLPPLPAAVEVAAYRIALEALTNVVRHAGARSCTIRLVHDAAGGVLGVTVDDDGRGLPAGQPAGVGLASMRERAAELGGTCRIEGRPAGGTRVCARLPLPAAPAASPAGRAAPP